MLRLISAPPTDQTGETLIPTDQTGETLKPLPVPVIDRSDDLFALDRCTHFLRCYRGRLGGVRLVCRSAYIMTNHLVVLAVKAKVQQLLGPQVSAHDLMAAFADTWKMTEHDSHEITPVPRAFLATKALIFLDLFCECARDHPVSGSAALFIEELVAGRAPKWSPGDIDVWHTHWVNSPPEGPWAYGKPPPKDALQCRLIDSQWDLNEKIDIASDTRTSVAKIDRTTCMLSESSQWWTTPDEPHSMPGQVITWKLWFGVQASRNKRQAVQIVWQPASHVSHCECFMDRARLCISCARRLTGYYGYGVFNPDRPDRSSDLDVVAVTARLVDQRIELMRDLPRVPNRIHVRPYGLCVMPKTLPRIVVTPDAQNRLRDRITKYRERGLCEEVLIPKLIYVPSIVIGELDAIDTASVASLVAEDGTWVRSLHYAPSGELIGYLMVTV